MPTDAMKKWFRKYQHSSRGEAAQARANKKYRDSKRGRSKAAEWNKKYDHSERGKLVRARNYKKRRIKVLESRLEQLNEQVDNINSRLRMLDGQRFCYVRVTSKRA
jgi:hypothetical protein